MSENLIEGYEPDENDQSGSGTIIALKDKGAYFQGVVTRIGDVYEANFGDQFWVNVELEYASPGVLSEELGIGDEGGWPIALEKNMSVKDVRAGKKARPSHDMEELTKALRKVGKAELSEGDTLAVKVVDVIPSKSNPTFKPFRKKVYIVTPGKPVNVIAGASDGDSEAPF